VLVVWTAGYAFLTRDPDATAYRELCVQSAQNALDGLGTARMAADDGLIATYQTAMTDDAGQLIGQARSQLTATVPPDDRSGRLRDTLVPLVDRSERLYEDLVRSQAAGDEPAERAVIGRMADLQDQLRDFIDGNRG
jgi:hypothetical protein